jgi:hypothetical protein
MKSSVARRARAVAGLSYIFSVTCCISGAFTIISLASLDDAHALTGTIDTYVGGGNGDGDAAINAAIDPRGLVLVGPANAPDIYVADAKNNRVRRVDGDTGLIETIAGNGVYGSAAMAAMPRTRRGFPFDVAVDGAGNVYRRRFNNRIRKVGTDRRITTVAGTVRILHWRGTRRRRGAEQPQWPRHRARWQSIYCGSRQQPHSQAEPTGMFGSQLRDQHRRWRRQWELLR